MNLLFWPAGSHAEEEDPRGSFLEMERAICHSISGLFLDVVF